MPRPSWWIHDAFPCIGRPARTIAAPYAAPMHWWPRHTPKIGIVGAQPAHHVGRDPRFGGRARPGRDHDVRRRERRDSFHRNRVMPHDVRLEPQLARVARQVVDEGVVVVDEQDHGTRAAMRPPALSSVSRYSCSGSESATIPPPAWKYTMSPSTRYVRITMLVSNAPVVTPVADRAAIHPAPRRLELGDDLHRADLGRARDRPAGEGGAHQVCRDCASGSGRPRRSRPGGARSRSARARTTRARAPIPARTRATGRFAGDRRSSRSPRDPCRSRRAPWPEPRRAPVPPRGAAFP